MRSAIVTFFDCYPPKTGSGNVCFDFFLLGLIVIKNFFNFQQIT